MVNTLFTDSKSSALLELALPDNSAKTDAVSGKLERVIEAARRILTFNQDPDIKAVLEKAENIRELMLGKQDLQAVRAPETGVTDDSSSESPDTNMP